MSAIRIYADFNGLVRGPRNPERTAVVLDTFGSVRDLSNAGIILQEGLPIIAVDWSDDQEDLEGHGAARFDAKRNWWVVEFDDLGVRYVAAGKRDVETPFLCVSCRRQLDVSSSDAFTCDKKCATCGTSVLASIAPPR